VGKAAVEGLRRRRNSTRNLARSCGMRRGITQPYNILTTYGNCIVNTAM
jgi:hypothetical protein